MTVGDGDGDEHPEGTDGDFDGDEVGKAVVLGTASEDDDLKGKGDGAGEGEEVSAIERGERESLAGRNAEKVEADEGGADSGEGIAVDVAPPEDGEQKRDQDDGDSGEEGGLGGGGVEQAGGLEFIAEPHEGSDFKAGAQGSDGEAAQLAEKDDAEDDGGKGHADGVEDERGGVGERRLDDDESGAPDKSCGQQQEMGLERTRH